MACNFVNLYQLAGYFFHRRHHFGDFGNIMFSLRQTMRDSWTSHMRYHWDARNGSRAAWRQLVSQCTHFDSYTR